MREAGIFANVLLCGLGLLIAFGLGAVQSSKVWLCEHCLAKRKHFVKFHKCHTHPHTHTFSIAKFSPLAHNFPQVFVLHNKSLTIFSSYGGILVLGTPMSHSLTRPETPPVPPDKSRPSHCESPFTPKVSPLWGEREPGHLGLWSFSSADRE